MSSDSACAISTASSRDETSVIQDSVQWWPNMDLNLVCVGLHN